MTKKLSIKNLNVASKPVAMHPVVIAGAGPVGCAAALYLAQETLPGILTALVYTAILSAVMSTADRRSIRAHT